VKRHQPDLTSLIAGLTFCTIAIAFLGAQLFDRRLELRWVVPIVLIGLGLAGLAGTMMRAQRSIPRVYEGRHDAAGADDADQPPS
jgi:hypothetical protein